MVHEIHQIKEVLSKKDEHKKESDEIIDLQMKVSETRSKKESLVRDSGKLEAEVSYLSRSIRDEETKSRENDQKTILLSEVGVLKRSIDEYVAESERTEEVGALRSLIVKIKDALGSFIEIRASSSKESEEKISTLSREKEEKLKEKEKIEIAIAELTEQEAGLRRKEQDIKAEMDRKKDDTFEAEKKMLELMSKEQEIENHLHSLRVEEERVSALYEEFKRDLHEAGMLIGHEVLRYKETMSGMVEDRQTQIERRKDVERKKIRLEEMGGSNGAEIMKEYQDVSERDRFLEKELVDLGESSVSLQTLITDLEKKIDTEFKEGLIKINKEFETFFSLMFGGGHAALKLVKEEKRRVIDEEEGDETMSGLVMGTGTDTTMPDMEETKEGIEIDVALPHKKTKGLVMLSGGERALTSIALLFAISQVNPPPFVILDETDAALDEANSRKYGDMIERLASHSGLILITHNRETMSRAGVIYGVTMGSEGFSKLLSIQFDEAVVVAK